MSTWQRYNGTSWITPTAGHGYPGQFTGTGNVTISHTVTIGTGGITTQNMGRITVTSAGRLYLTGTNAVITFTLNTMELVVNPGGSVYFFNKVKLQLPADAVLFVTTNGLLTDNCNNNKEIWIGTQKYAACAGAPGDIYTFDQLMAVAAGGTLNAIPADNGPLCFNQTMQLTGSYSGAIGSAVVYSWRVISPANDTSYFSTQNVNIPNTILGTYRARLTVLTVLNGTTYTNSETKLVVVNPLPTLTNATLTSETCDGSTAIISLSGLIPSTTFTVNYSINGVSQAPVTGVVANNLGVANFFTSTLTSVNNGQILRITGLTITSWANSCSQTFSKDVTLAVISIGSWIGVTSTDWNTASNWCGGVPIASTSVIIPSTAPFQPVVGIAGGVCRNITINAGASLTIAANSTLSVNGNWVNNGSFIANSGTVNFNGTTAISGSSVNSFYNLSIAAISSLTAPSGVINVANNFVNAGTFNHNNGTIIFNGLTTQQINSGGSSFNNFSISNTVGTVTALSNLNVLGNFTTNISTTLDMSTYLLGVSTVSHSGTLLTQNTSVSPITVGKVWGGTVNYNSALAAQTVSTGTYNNLSIYSVFGATAINDITVNGILNLAVGNPSATKGSLDMWDGSAMKTLYMGASSTTIGMGDVSGRVKRNSFTPNTVYTFGSQYTTIAFTNGTGAQLPDELLFIIKIGQTHPIKSNTLKRYYEIVRTGSNPGSAPTRFNLTLKYLDSELNGSNESNLVFWDHHIPYAGPSPHEHGQSAQNTSSNFITLASHSISYLVLKEYSQTGEIAYIDDVQTPQSQSKIWMVSERVAPSGDSIFVWLGTDPEFPTDWTKNNNWQDNKSPTNAILEGIPATKHYVYIPATPNKPVLPTNDTTRVKYLYIFDGGVLNARQGKLFQANYVRIYEGGTYKAENSTIEVLGALNQNNGDVSWNNLGAFDAGTSVVKFLNANSAISGTTNFYDVQIGSGMKLSMIGGSVMRIANTVTNSGTWNTVFYGETMVGYNGLNPQTVILPEGNQYYHIELSGSGVKTLPNSEFTTLGDFSLSGLVSVLANQIINVNRNFSIGAGTTFTAGNLTHKIGGNWSNAGTFNATGSTIEFNGVNSGSIGSSNFNNITFSGNGVKNAIGSLSIGGNVLILNNFTAGNFTHFVSGSWTNNGVFNANSSTIEFIGNNDASINSSNFNNITFSGAGVKTAQGVLSIAGNVDIVNNFTAGNFTHTVGGNWTKNGTFVSAGSSINFNGTTSGNIGSSNFNNIIFSGSGLKTATGVLSIDGNVSITNNFTAGSFTHTVSGNWSNSGTFNSIGSTINFNGSSSANIGSSNFNNVIFSGSGTNTASGILNIAGNVTIDNNFTAGNFIHTVGQNWTKNGTFVSDGSTIDFNTSNSGNISASNFNNLIFSGSGEKTALGVLSVDGNVLISNNFTAGNFTHTVGGNWTNSGTFNANGSTIDFVGNNAANIGASNFNHIIFSGNGSKTAVGSLAIAGNMLISNNFTAGNFTHSVGQNWTNNGVFTPSNSTIDFNTGNSGLISSCNFNNISFTGGGIKSASGSLSINGSLLISNNFHAGNYLHTVGGNFSNVGVFYNDLGTITFNGNVSQSIFSGGSKFYDVIFNNNSLVYDNFNVTDPMIISNSATFTKGIIVVSGLGLVSFEKNASSINANALSFVDGPVRKIGNTSYTFPTGNNNYFAPIKISDAQGTSFDTDWFTARYINENPLLSYSTIQLPIQIISRTEYWTLDRVGTNNVFVTLSWDERSGGIGDLASLLVARWDGSIWTTKGQTAITGDLTSGTITSELVTNFSPFTLGSSSNKNTLPITLISFNADCKGAGNVELRWKTASEINNSYFAIERSIDTKKWEVVGTVLGSGNSNTVMNYSFIDNILSAENQNDLFYYRLKQVDFDGTTARFDMISVSGCKNNNSFSNGIKVFPNPFKNEINVSFNSNSSSQINITISNLDSKPIKEFSFSGNEVGNNISLDLSFLSAGVYMLNFDNGIKKEMIKIVKL